MALTLQEDFKEPRIFDEKLTIDDTAVLSREGAEVRLNLGTNKQSQFALDWHMLELPLIQEQDFSEPISVFRKWLAHSAILSPIPSRMNGYFSDETLYPRNDASNFGDWLNGILRRYPAAYLEISKYLKELMPDINDFRNDPQGKDAKKTLVRFSQGQKTFEVPFESLSDGEKLMFVCAAVTAANKYYGPLLCFRDEPDAHMSLSEVSHFITHLRRTFENGENGENGGQLLVTAHGESAIRAFSDESTFLLDRKSHLEPTLIRRLDEMSPRPGESTVEMLRLGDLEL